MHGPTVTELDAKHVITLLQYLLVNHTRKLEVKLVFRRDHHPISSHLKSYADTDKDLLDLVWANQVHVRYLWYRRYQLVSTPLAVVGGPKEMLPA